jgi:hypothetical protein
MLHRFEQSVLADALLTAKKYTVVDLDFGMLHPLRQPHDDTIGILGINLAHVIEPRFHLAGFALERRRAIQVQTDRTGLIDPAAFGDDLVVDEQRQAGRPSHLMHRAILIEPDVRLDVLFLAVVIEHRLVVLIDQQHRRQLSIDAGRRPRFARRQKNIIVHRPVGDEVIERNGFLTHVVGTF